MNKWYNSKELMEPEKDEYLLELGRVGAGSSQYEYYSVDVDEDMCGPSGASCSPGLAQLQYVDRQVPLAGQVTESRVSSR